MHFKRKVISIFKNKENGNCSVEIVTRISHQARVEWKAKRRRVKPFCTIPHYARKPIWQIPDFILQVQFDRIGRVRKWVHKEVIINAFVQVSL